jgi:hypothetical protein
VIKLCLALGLACASAACGATGPEDRASVVLTSGTSFGMCGGYCVTELRIDSLSITLTETSQVMDLPARVRTLPLSASDCARLQARVDTAAFREIEGVHGCPDCADGGAEWIQVETEEPMRVTFEYGVELDGIEDLQAEIRELRGRFEP